MVGAWKEAISERWCRAGGQRASSCKTLHVMLSTLGFTLSWSDVEIPIAEWLDMNCIFKGPSN